MSKTKKSITKRVRKTKNEKIIIYVPGRAHNLAKKEKRVKKFKKSVKKDLI